MNKYHVRLRHPYSRTEDVMVEVSAASKGAASRFATSQYPGYQVVAVQFVDETHQHAVAVAEQMLKFASYSRDPRFKALAVLSRPAAEIAVIILEEVNRYIEQGIKRTEDIAKSILNSML